MKNIFPFRLRTHILPAIIMLFLFFTDSFAADRVTELQSRLEQLVSSAGCDISVQVVSASKYDQLYSYNAGQKMIPASITKIVTAAAALEYLGADFKLKTVVYTDSKPEGGVINGNIYLKGFGDPDLNSGDIVNLARQLSGKGINAITGNVIFDESYFDKAYYGLSGTYASDTRSQYWPYVSALNLDKNPGNYDPAAAAGDILANELRNMGVRIDGMVTAGITPSNASEMAMTAHNLTDVLTYMNKVSNNHSAITLFKVIGAKVKSPPGSLDKGTEAVMSFLTSIGIDRYSFEVLEGSGLTRYNFVTSNMFIRLLKYMYDNEQMFDHFYSSLAIAGVDGTLRDRMIGTEAEKNVHAKTGTLNSVSTLSGYAVSRDNELLIFYIAMNGFGGGNGHVKNIQDAICEELCMFSRN